MQAATLGSQEGAFENVRLNFSGDQGQTIRQLVSGHCVKREAMCALLSQNGKRQHLCVNHDKGKLTVLQLFPILKQADSNRRKLTLTVSGCVGSEWVGGGFGAKATEFLRNFPILYVFLKSMHVHIISLSLEVSYAWRRHGLCCVCPVFIWVGVMSCVGSRLKVQV